MECDEYTCPMTWLKGCDDAELYSPYLQRMVPETAIVRDGCRTWFGVSKNAVLLVSHLTEPRNGREPGMYVDYVCGRGIGTGDGWDRQKLVGTVWRRDDTGWTLRDDYAQLSYNTVNSLTRRIRPFWQWLIEVCDAK